MPGVRIVASLTSALLVAGLASACATRMGSEKPGTRHEGTAEGRLNGLDVVQPGTPCPMAVHGAVTEIAAASEAPVYLPSSGAEAVTDAWRCDDTPVVMFGDVQLSFSSGYDAVDGRGPAEEFADALGGSVQSVQGISAFVVDDPNDEVLMIKDGTAIRLLAPGSVPIGHLIDLAKALDLSHPVN